MRKRLLATALACCMMFGGGDICNAAVRDSIGNAPLMQTIGDYDDDSSARTLFGLIRQIIAYCTAIKSNTEGLIKQMNDFQTAVTGQINTLETSVTGQINTLSAKVDKCHNDELTAISNIYRVSASNAFSASQVKSTKAAAVSPKQVLLKWNCTQDNDCSISSASSNALSNWTDIKAFNIYYGTTANAAKMTYYGTVNKNDSKLFYQNYEYTVSGLDPNTTYYFWVTSVMSDDMELEDSSAVRTVTTPTLASAQVTNLKSTPDGGTSLKLTWSGNYSGYVTYRIYYGTSALSVNSGTTAKATTTSTNYTITGLTAGQSYYVAVCAVINNGTTWVSNPGTVNSCGYYITAMTCPTGTFATASSWEDVRLITKCGRAYDQFTIGETRTIDLSSIGAGTATITLVDISSDNDITCMFTKYTGTTPTHFMNSTATNSGSWSASAMRSWLNGSGFYDKLPSDLRAVIVDSTVITGTWNGTATGGSNTSTVDKLYLPAEIEIFGGIQYSPRAEADVLKQFAYFADSSTDRILDFPWWLRSPYIHPSNLEANQFFCNVYYGRHNGDTAVRSHKVFPVFKIK